MHRPTLGVFRVVKGPTMVGALVGVVSPER